MLNSAGSPVTQIVVSGNQIPEFFGPDGVDKMWADPNNGGARFVVRWRTGAGSGFVEDSLNPGFYVPGDSNVTLSLSGGPKDVAAYGLFPTAGDKSTLWASILATASASNPLDLYFGPGTFRFDSPWPTIDPRFVRIRCAGEFHTNLDFTRLTSGPAINVQKAVGDNAKHIVLSDATVLGPTAVGTTVDGFNLGSASTYANQCVFERVRVDHFRDAWVLNDNTWCIDWVNCYENAQIRYGFNSAGTANAGENYSLFGGTIAASGSDCIRVASSNGATFNLFGVSLDYSNHLITLQNGNRVNMFGGHIECGDAQTGAELIGIIKGSTYNPALVLKGVTLYAGWTSAGTIKTVVRVTGTTGATNDNAVIDLDGLEVISGASPTGVNALVIDQSTVGTNAAATKETHILARGISYRDAGGAIGPTGYFPWYVQDRVGRKHFISPGIDYGNVVYDYPHRASAWAGPAIHVSETVPRKTAVDTFQPASGDLYVVRLPVVAGDTWVASASELMIALATNGSTITTQAVGLYDYSTEANLPSVMTRFFNTTGLNFTTGAPVIKTTNPGAVTMMYPRINIYGAFLFVTGTMPFLYGVKAAAQSPLLDPQSSVFPLEVGKLTGQTSLPSTITVSALVKSEWVPWMALRPTTYA